MRLIDWFTAGRTEEETTPPRTFGAALTDAMRLLCHGDSAVMQRIGECLSDTKAYCETWEESFDERGLTYHEEGAPWLQLVAAVNAAEDAGYLCELDWKCAAEEFRAAVQALLSVGGLTFSLEQLAFDENKAVPDWAAWFNQYAGQSGLTLYAIDIDSDSYVMGIADLADYACAAEWAGSVGIRITSRFA